MVPKSNGSTVKTAVEDFLHAVTDNKLAVAIQEAIDQLDVHLEPFIEDVLPTPAPQDLDPNLHNRISILVNDSDDLRPFLPPIDDNTILVYFSNNKTPHLGTITFIEESDLLNFNMSYNDCGKETLNFE